MCLAMKMGLFIAFIMSAIMACSASQTFTVMEYGPGAELRYPTLQFSQALEPGMVLSFIASATDTSRFDIKDSKNNVLICVYPTIRTSVVAFSSLFGKWTTELKSPKVNIKSGEKFSLHIAYERNGYRIFFEGEEIYFYKHLSENPATSLYMPNWGKKDDKYYYISHTLNEPKWAVRSQDNGMYIKEFNEHGKESPHEIQFQGSHPISSIVITGIINSNADNVDFNLTNSAGEDIFYFSIRLTENYVARNSHLEGALGKEERNGGMPFRRNERFTLAIDVEVDYYQIYVNGLEFITYKHRTSYYNAIKLQISAGMNIFKTIYQK